MIRIGLLGAGFMGSTHAACYGLIENAALVGVADARTELAGEIADKHGCPHPPYRGLREMLDKIGDDIDAVDGCLPTFLHADTAVMALEAGKHTIVEKPLALTVPDGRRVVAAARRSGMQCMVAHVIRFWPEYVYLREVCQSGELGQLRNATMWRITQRRKRGTSWEEWLYEPERCGSPAMDLHIHDLDFARILLGDPTSFAARGTVYDGRMEHLFAQYSFAKGATVNIESGWDFPLNYPFEMGFRCVFEQGALEYRSSAGTKKYLADGTCEEVEVPTPQIPDTGTIGNVASIVGYYAELAYFVGRLDASEPIEVGEAADSLASLEILLKVVRSA